MDPCLVFVFVMVSATAVNVYWNNLRDQAETC